MARNLTDLIAILLLVTPVLLWIRKRVRRRHLPPGPPMDPIIGHLLRMPSEQFHHAFHEMAKTYGEIFYLEVLGQPIMVIDSHAAAVELLEKRGALHSSRPPLTVLNRMGWNDSVFTQPYGPRLTKMRKLFFQGLGPREMPNFEALQLRESRYLLKGLLSTPNDYEVHASRYAAAVIVKITFGHEIISTDDEFLIMAQELSASLGNSGPPGSTALDFLPALFHFPSWFPGTHYATFAKYWFPKTVKFHEYPIEWINERQEANIIQPSFLAKELEKAKESGQINDPEHMQDLKGLIGNIYVGGSDAIASTLDTFIAAMALFPEVQRRAQEEIDRVTGSSRLPDPSDRESLPYASSVLLETIRWQPVAPLGVPHYSMEDDVYNGMFIPKGTQIIANAMGTCYDEKVYKDPTLFNPSRFLPKPEGGGEPEPNAAFGFGRRICPGRFLADTSVWMAMVSILAVFDISMPIGEDGREFGRDLKFTEGLIRQPKDFPCQLKVRGNWAVRLIDGGELTAP